MVDISIHLGGSVPTPPQSDDLSSSQSGNLQAPQSNPVFPAFNMAKPNLATPSQGSNISISLKAPQNLPPAEPQTAPQTGQDIKLKKTYTHQLNSADKLEANKDLDGQVQRQDDGRNRMNILLSTLANKGADDVAKITQYWPVNASVMFDKVANGRQKVDKAALAAYAKKHDMFDPDDLQTLFDNTFDIDGDGTTTHDEFAQVSDSGQALAGNKRRYRPKWFD